MNAQVAQPRSINVDYNNATCGRQSPIGMNGLVTLNPA